MNSSQDLNGKFSRRSGLEQRPTRDLQPISVISVCRVKPPYQCPEVLGVIGMDQMAQFMDHHIVSDGMRCLDDVPVEDQLTSGIARPPAGLEVANTDA